MQRGEVDSGMGDGGLFMGEGILVIEKMIRSSFGMHSILGTAGRLDALEARVGLPDVPVYEAEQGVMDAIAGFPIHRGLLACGLRGAPPAVESLLKAERLVLLEDLANHDNVGGIFRTVAALGRGRAGIVLSPRCCDPLYRKALRVSMGHVLDVPHARSVDWEADLRMIRDWGFEILALEPNAPHEMGAVTGPTALLVGAEGSGLSAQAQRGATRSVRISITPGVDSLNAGVAVAIALDRLGGRP